MRTSQPRCSFLGCIHSLLCNFLSIRPSPRFEKGPTFLDPPVTYPLLGPKYTLFGAVYPKVRVVGGSWLRRLRSEELKCILIYAGASPKKRPHGDHILGLGFRVGTSGCTLNGGNPASPYSPNPCFEDPKWCKSPSIHCRDSCEKSPSPKRSLGLRIYGKADCRVWEVPKFPNVTRSFATARSFQARRTGPKPHKPYLDPKRRYHNDPKPLEMVNKTIILRNYVGEQVTLKAGYCRCCRSLRYMVLLVFCYLPVDDFPLYNMCIYIYAQTHI